MAIRITYDSKTIDLNVGPEGLQTNFKNFRDQRQSSSGKTETINQHGLIHGSFEAYFSESIYQDLLGWWAWARQGKTWAFAKDSDKAATTTLGGTAAAGQKVVPLASVSGLSVGDIIYLRAEDADDEYEAGEIESLSATENDADTLALIRASDSGACAFTDHGEGPNSPHAVGEYQTPTCSDVQTKNSARSMHFDGTGTVNAGDGLDLADSADWVPGAGSYTMDAWVYLTGWTGQPQTIFARRNGGVTWPTVYFEIKDTTGFLTANCGNNNCTGQYISRAGSSGVSLNTWTHVGAIINRTTNKTHLYKDFAEVSSYAQQDTISTDIGDCNSGAAMRVGYAIMSSAQHYFFQGYMDDARVSDVIRDFGAGVTLVDNLKNSYNSADTFRHLEYFPAIVSLDEDFTPRKSGATYRHTFNFAELL